MKTAVIVPTLNAGLVWPDWIGALQKTGKDVNDVYIIDSGSSDETVLHSVNAGFNVIKIKPGTFNHGGTRQLAVDDLVDYDVVIFLTQDAILHDHASLESILAPFEGNEVAAVCGRQLPAKTAAQIAAHARIFNYPPKSYVRSAEDSSQFGLKTIFISNSFAAYRVSALNEVGGFPDNVIFGEDMFVAAKLLKAGYKLAYAAEACVYHSHNYSVQQEFKRYFDMGVFHAREPWIRQDFGGAEGEGVKFVISEFKYLLKHEPVRIPEAFFRTILRYTGFRLGLLEKWLPLRLKRLFAMNKGFFKE